jgi:predicted transcriptional regulator
MSAEAAATTGSVTVRLPIDLLTQLDALCALTERTRTYWLTKAVEEVIPAELTDAQIIADEFAAIDAHPDEGLPNEHMDEWMITNGLTTREALARARAKWASKRA